MIWARQIVKSPWKKTFALWPVTTVGKERVWLSRIYKRRVDIYVDNDRERRIEYGTLFDIIKNE